MPTHGSLSKAGKVRDNTPKVSKSTKQKSIPRIRNKRNYENRFELERKVGQNLPPRQFRS